MRRVVGCLVALVAFVAPASAQAISNTDPYPFMLEVWTNNVENLQNTSAANQCVLTAPYANPNPLVDRMQARQFAPDIVMVQQVDGRDDQLRPDGRPRNQLKQLVDEMNRRFWDPPHGIYIAHYSSIVADIAPSNAMDSVEPSNCLDNKKYQTNGIIYRDTRLSYDNGYKLPYQSWRKAGCNTPNFQDRSLNLTARFTDNVAHKKVDVTTFHWPTDSGIVDGKRCATANANTLSSKSSSLGAALSIAGGDANVPNNWLGEGNTSWYFTMYGNGFREATPNAKAGQVVYLWARNPASIANQTSTTINAPEFIEPDTYPGHSPIRGWAYY